MLYLNKKHLQEIIKHCQKEYPNESCGILAGKKNKVMSVYQMENTSDNPEICYFMDPKEQLKIFKELRNLKLELLGIYHSHTHSEAYPSKRDVEMAYYSEVAYIIVSLKNFNKPEVKAYKIIDDKIKKEKIIIER